MNILAGDSDPQAGQTLSLTGLSLTGTKGAAVLNANGTVTYTPGAAFLSLAAGATATDSFGYTVSDSHGVSSTGTETVTVTGVAIPPVANADTATMAATSSGVWISATANDTDVKGYALAVTAVNNTGTKGLATLNPTATGGVFYSPGTAFAYLSVGETATDSFTYTISDGHGGTATATDTITITGVNQAPVGTAETAATKASASVAISLLTGVSDVNRDDVLSVSGLTTTGTKGSVTLSAGGVATYTPGAAFQYLAAGVTATDSFGYTATDNNGATSTSTATVTVTGTWLPPTAAAETSATTAGAPITLNILAGDSDPQAGQTLSLTGLSLTGTKGAAVLNANGTVTYTPGAAFLSLAAGATATDSFGYTVSDSHGVSSTGTETVTVTGVAIPPVANADTATMAATSSGVWISATANDTDVKGYALAVTAVNNTGTKGLATLNPTATGGVFYSPGTAFAYLSVGETATDSFTYTISDGHGGTATATDTIIITGVNQAPVAANDAAATTASQAVSIGLLSSVSDVNRDDVLSVTGLTTTATKGSVTLGAGGVATYTPGAAFQYLAAGVTATDSFGYTVADNHGASSTATTTVTVTGTWKPPVATAQTASVSAATPITLNILAGDSDPQTGQTLSLTGLSLTGTKGAAVLNANGTVTYTPGAAFLSLAAGATATDSFGYTVSDSHGVSSTGTETVTVTGVAIPPVANADTATMAATSSGVWISATANDTDVKGYALAVTAVNNTGTKGLATLNPTATGGVFYSPGTAFAYLSVGETATDTFTYTISDGHGGTATATDTITITGVNQAPVATAETAATKASASVAISLLTGVSDVNRDDVLSVSGLTTTGTKGSVTLSAGGVATYTPGAAFQYLAAGVTATDSFGYTATDNNGATSTSHRDGDGHRNLAAADSLRPKRPPPPPAPQSRLNILAGDSDPQAGQTLSLTGLSLTGTKGAAVLNANGTVTYTPGAAFLSLAAGATATDSFGYTVSDSHGVSSTGTETVTVTGVAIPPVANADTATMAATSSGVWISATANDTDVKGYALAVTAVNNTGTKGLATLNPTATGGVFYSPGTAFAYLSVGETATDSVHLHHLRRARRHGHGDRHHHHHRSEPGAGSRQRRGGDHGVAAVAIGLLASVSDVNRDDVLSVTGLTTTATKGSVTLGAGGVATYTPGAAFQYLAAGVTATDSFGYTVADNHGASSTATTTVTVTGTWKPPVATAQTASASAATPITLNILAGDSDPQTGQTLSLTGLSLTGTKGAAVLNANGTVTYTPGAAFLSLAAGATATDSFGYTVSDSHGVSSTGTETVTVTGVAIPPVANADTATMAATSSGVWISATANDTDVKGYALAVTAVNNTGTKGLATLNATSTGGVFYSPGTAFAYLSVGETATDSFTYTISDGHGGTATATDTITITGVNQAPILAPGKASATAQQSTTIGLLANATDVNRDDVLSVTSLNTKGTKGTVTLDANGVATYTPGAAFQYLAIGATSTDSFTDTVSDNHGAATTATDTVTITGTWQSPVAAAETASTDANHSVTLNVLADATDPQGIPLSVSALNLTGTNGTAVINADGTITYTPGAAFSGLAAGSATSDSFGYAVSDGHGGTSVATVNVTVTAAGASAPAPQAFYVATNGNDSWSGRLAVPNAAGTDGPFATLKVAQTAMEASPTVNTTYVEGGDYYESSTLTLNASDSGESWLGMPGQTAVIHGGQQVTGWVQGAGGIWTAPAPTGSLAAGSGVADLFVNGVRETHARYPDAAPSNPVQGGWLTAAASLPGETTVSSFQFNPGDIPTLTSTTGLYVAVYQQNGWQDYTLPVASINYTTDTITLGSSSSWPIDVGSRYYLFNASSQLNVINEWYGDTASSTITLDPASGFTGADVTVGSLASVIQLNSASNVTIAGLTIEGSTSTGDGIRANNASGLVLAGDTITDVGNGIELAGVASGIDIEGSLISNTDNNGLLIDPGTNLVTVKGNTFDNIGQLVDGDGIWFTGSSNDVIANNLVENVAHSGIAGGSVVGLSDASYNDSITANMVQNVNISSSDGGGIYITGRQLTSTGDVVSNNTIVGATAAGTAATAQMTFLSPTQLTSYGIYLDDYASSVTVQGNLLINSVGGIDVHAGSNNTITDNVIVNSTGVALNNASSNYIGLPVIPSGNVFSGNLVSDSQPGATLSANLGNPSAASWTGNFYDVAGLSTNSFISDTAGVYKVQSLAAWQTAGYDSGAATGIPGFVAGGTYALTVGSGASAFGISIPAAGASGLVGFIATNSYDLAGR